MRARSKREPQISLRTLTERVAMVCFRGVQSVWYVVLCAGIEGLPMEACWGGGAEGMKRVMNFRLHFPRLGVSEPCLFSGRFRAPI